MATLPKSQPTRTPVNLPAFKSTNQKARTLGSLVLPVSKAPAQRGGCCGR